MPNIEKGVITAQTSAGTQTITLPSGFDLKGVILFTSHATADGIVDGNAYFGFGMASLNGGGIQQATHVMAEADADATTDNNEYVTTTEVLRGYLAPSLSPTYDFVATMSAMATESFTLNWTNPPAAAIKVHYWAVGGSDIDACVHQFTVTASLATPVDVTVATGFGQPDLVLFSPSADRTATGNSSRAFMALGAGKPGETGRAASYGSKANVSTVEISSAQRDHALLVGALTANLFNNRADVAPKVDGPTDGYRLNYAANRAGVGVYTIAMALKGSFVAKIGNGQLPTSADSQIHALEGGTPKGALIWGGSEAPTTNNVISGGDLGGFFLGAASADNSAQGCIGHCDDDGAADSYTGRSHSTSKVYQVIKTDAGAPALQSEASAIFHPSSLELIWADPDSVGRDYNYLIIGDAKTTPTSYLGSDQVDALYVGSELVDAVYVGDIQV